MLNFYAKRWKEISEETKDSTVNIPNVSSGSNDKILSSILELTDYADRIAMPERKRWSWYRKFVTIIYNIILKNFSW